MLSGLLVLIGLVCQGDTELSSTLTALLMSKQIQSTPLATDNDLKKAQFALSLCR